MSLRENIDANKKHQEELKKVQQSRDRGNTYGHDSKDPCKKEKASSLMCLDLSYVNKEIDCQPYFDNYKKCNQFWLAVQVYRSRVFKKRRYDLPVGEEYDKWKQQLPKWIETGELDPPEI